MKRISILSGLIVPVLGVAMLSAPASVAATKTTVAVAAKVTASETVISWKYNKGKPTGQVLTVVSTDDNGAALHNMKIKLKSSKRSYSFTNLTQGAAYRISISSTKPVSKGSVSFVGGRVGNYGKKTTSRGSNGSSTTKGNPVALSGVKIVAEEDGASLSWNEPSDRSITGYRVEYRIPNTNWRLHGVTADPFYDVTDLRGGRTYYFRVAAINSYGIGKFTSEFTVVPLIAVVITNPTPTPGSTTPPSTRSNLAAPKSLEVYPGDRAAYVIWELSTDRSVISYQVGMRLQGGSWATGHNKNLSLYEPTGLVNGSIYEFRVAAVSAAGVGNWSNVLCVVPGSDPNSPQKCVPNQAEGSSGGVTPTPTPTPTPPATVVNAPTGLTITPSTTPGNAVLTWTAPVGGITPSGYNVEYAVGNGIFAPLTSLTGTALALTSLVPGSTYRFQVIALGSGKFSVPSAVVTITIPGGTPAPTPTPTPTPSPTPTTLNAPTGLTVTASTKPGEASLTWVAPADGMTPTGYRVDFAVGTGSFAQLTTVTGTALNLTSLVPGTTYRFQVIATAGTQSSTPSAAATITVAGGTTPAPTPTAVPGAPTMLSAAASAGGKATLSWTAPTIGTVTSYTLELSADGKTWVPYTSGVVGTAIQASQLELGRTYYFRVAAVNATGQGTWSVPTSVKAI